MKKLLIVGFMLASAHSFSQGQMKKFHLGFKGGGNYSDFGNTNFSSEGLYGFHAGAILEFRFNDWLSVQQDILFSTQGAKFKDVNTFGQEELKLSYVSIPIMLKYRTKMGLYFEAGPQINLKVDDNIENTELKDFAKKLDYGIAGGLGYQSKMGLGIGARYIAGLAKVPDFKYANVNTDFKNNVAQISLFYIF